jgi:hypothetical protein
VLELMRSFNLLNNVSAKRINSSYTRLAYNWSVYVSCTSVNTFVTVRSTADQMKCSIKRLMQIAPRVEERNSSMYLLENTTK